MARGERIPRLAWPTRRKEWARRLAEWAASGLSQAAYCRREGLDQCTFSGWKRRLGWKKRSIETGVDGEREPVRSAGRPGGDHTTRTAGERTAFFVPLSVAGTPACATNSRLEVVLRNGRVVRCESSVRPAVLAALAAALETNGAPC